MKVEVDIFWVIIGACIAQAFWYLGMLFLTLFIDWKEKRKHNK